MPESFESRFQRLVDMLYQLQRPEGQTAAALARRYTVSRRTINRDMETLRRADFPIEDLGLRHGYRLDPSYRLPHRALTLNEVIPLVLGASIVGGHEPEGLDKLRAVAQRGTERVVVANLPARVVSPGLTPNEERWLPVLTAAVSSGEVVCLTYGGTVRQVEPWSLLYQNQRWYLHAYDQAALGERRFRLDRIIGLTETRRPATVPRPPAAAASFHAWDLGGGKSRTVTLLVSPELEAWLRENPAHASQALESGRVTYQVRNAGRFFRWLMSLEGAELESPKTWRRELLIAIERLAARYRHRLPHV